MSRICIITDSTAQFTQADYPGREAVFIIPFLQETVHRKEDGPLPPQGAGVRLVPPSPQDFQNLYQELSHQYDSILVLMLSSHLSPAASHALSASNRFRNSAQVEVLDTKTTSVGLGWLVQQAAGLAHAGESAEKIIKLLRQAVKRIYFLFFIPELGGLVETGQLSSAQALVAGMLGFLPIYILEDGRLAPLDKVHSQRAVLEYFEEFLDEFETPAHVALVYGSGQVAGRLNSLRQHIQGEYPGTQFSQHTLSPQLEALLGTQSVGMVIMQKG